MGTIYPGAPEATGRQVRERSLAEHATANTTEEAYDLIWSGEIDSYRLGRKLLVLRASVDAHIESRSGRK